MVLAANDPVAAWGGVRLLADNFGVAPVAVTGPATDNLAGTRILEETLDVAAVNARTDGERLAALACATSASVAPRTAPRLRRSSPGSRSRARFDARRDDRRETAR